VLITKGLQRWKGIGEIMTDENNPTEQQTGPEDTGDSSEDAPKPAMMAVRLWHGLWRKRIFFHHGGPNWAEVSVVILTGGILLVGGVQATIYWEQAQTMQRSLNQNQQTIALNMGQVAIANRNANTAEGTLTEAQNQTAATKDALKSAQNQMRLSVRPWLGLDDEGTDPPVQTTQLIFDKDGNATIGYQTRVKNFGTQAAQGVLTVGNLAVTEDINAIFKAEETACYSYAEPDIGVVIFPGKNRLAWQTASQFQRKDMISKTGDGKFQAWLGLCIRYRDQFGCPYRTGYIYNFKDTTSGARDLPMRFAATPNSRVDGEFRLYHGDLEPKQKEHFNDEEKLEFPKPCP
jgi:hypothetical protein